MHILLFTLDDARYGLSTDAVAEVIRAVAVTPLPAAPSVIEGVIDVRGLITPVFDLRARLGFESREVRPSDCFILVRTKTRTAALHVDTAFDLVSIDDRDVTAARAQVPATDQVAGVASLPDGLVMIHDVETFLSRTEAEALDAALASHEGAATAGQR